MSFTSHIKLLQQPCHKSRHTITHLSSPNSRPTLLSSQKVLFAQICQKMSKGVFMTTCNEVAPRPMSNWKGWDPINTVGAFSAAPFRPICALRLCCVCACHDLECENWLRHWVPIVFSAQKQFIKVEFHPRDIFCWAHQQFKTFQCRPRAHF